MEVPRQSAEVPVTAQQPCANYGAAEVTTGDDTAFLRGLQAAGALPAKIRRSPA